MSWKFNPPPGWPQQPEGWVPPPGWTPDPSWPAPPAGWQFWVPADSPPAQSPQAGSPPGGAAPSPFAGAPGAPSSGAPSSGAPSSGAPSPWAPSSGAPSPWASSSSTPGPTAAPPAAGGFGATPPGGGYYPPAAGGALASKPWFGRWWAILGLIGLLVVGAAIGYFGTGYALDQSSDSDQTATGGDPTAPPVSETGLPEPSDSPGATLPTFPPTESPGELPGTCGEVAVIMVGLISATSEAEDLDELAGARRTAADDVRALEDQATDDQERDAVVALADELDGAAEMVEDDPDEGTLNDSFDRVADAYSDYNEEAC